jgi:NADH-quinone oxidoreductase subunit E
MKEQTPDETGRSAQPDAIVDRVVRAHAGSQGALIPVLQEVQAKLGYLSVEVMEAIAERLTIPAARVFGVASFYSQFRLSPVGQYVIKVCHGTACHVQGATGITDAICDELATPNGETTADGKFTIDSVACLGCCSLAPCMMIEENTYGRLTPDQARKVLKHYGE